MPEGRKRVTLGTLFGKMEAGVPITMLTCYDYPTAYLMEEAGIDMLLVGDSLGMTILGYDSTLPVTMEMMIPHAQAVRRGSPSAWLIGDMPYMTYQPSVESAIRNAGRFMAEAACDAIKLEGGVEVADRVEAVASMGIPVMGHLGLTPQSVLRMGGYKVQGRDEDAARGLIDDARALAEAGVFAMVLEGLPREVARRITAEIDVPTIGIGAGPDCDGQVLVFHDMLGLFPDLQPRFVKRYAELGQLATEAVSRYVSEVRTGSFPGPEHAYEDDAGAGRQEVEADGYGQGSGPGGREAGEG